MGYSISPNHKPHAICIPYPAQGHLTPMLNLAKLLHQKGFHITFLNTEYNHRRLLESRGSNAVHGLLDFQFKTIPDGLPYSHANATQHIPTLWDSITKNGLAPLCDLISIANPPVTCLVTDAVMFFAVSAANKFNIPYALFFTTSACGYFGYLQYSKLVKHSLIPLKGMILRFLIFFNFHIF